MGIKKRWFGTCFWSLLCSKELWDINRLILSVNGMSGSRNWPALRRSRWSGFSVHMGKKNSNGSYEVSTSCTYEVSCHLLMLCTWHSACSHVDTWLPVQYIGFTPYVRFTQTPRGTWDWLTTKKWPNCRLLGSCSYVSCQKVRSYSWILAINRATRHWNRQALRPLLIKPSKSVVDLVNFTCEWPNSQLGRHLVASLCRLVVIHSMASYVIWHGRKSVASHSWNYYLMQTFTESHRYLGAVVPWS